MVTELKYSNTNTYLISGSRGRLLFDTGWAGTFPKLCKALKEKNIALKEIDYLLISHYHPDHMGLAQELAEHGVTIAAAEVQRDFLHSSDHIFAREKNSAFLPIDDGKVRFFPLSEGRSFLSKLGIGGEVIHTPGHSDDSISLWLDEERSLFVGDLDPLYNLELLRGTVTYQSWKKLLALKPEVVYYGHAKTARLDGGRTEKPAPADKDIYALVKRIMKLIDKGCSAEVIERRTGADPVFITDVARMYLTHQNVGVQGILDRIEIKGK